MVIVGIIIALIVCLFIPYSHWSTRIVSGRLVSEATIVARQSDEVTVRLFSMTASSSMVETGTFLTLQGKIPDDAHIGQRVRIGYSSREGLFANPDQIVQMAYFVDDNLLGGLLNWIIPFQSAGTDLQIVDIQADGSLLSYNVAA